MTSPQILARPSAGLDNNVHRAFGVRVRGLAPHTRADFFAVGEFEIKKAKSVPGVQALDQMLDVRLWILRVHQAGDRAFQARAD